MLLILSLLLLFCCFSLGFDSIFLILFYVFYVYIRILILFCSMPPYHLILLTSGFLWTNLAIVETAPLR